MVQACRKWQEGHEVSAKTIVPFIYNLMEKAYVVLTDRQGEDRKRILLAVLLHALDTKTDWSSEDEKDNVLMIVRRAGAVILNFGSVNIKEKVFGVIRQVKSCIADCKQECDCFGNPIKTK